MAKKKIIKFVDRMSAAKIYAEARGNKSAHINTFNTALKTRAGDLGETTADHPEQGDYYRDKSGKYFFNPESIEAFAKQVA